MKAIIISDDDSFIQKINDVLISFSYDVIIYKWLLKALDNVEEIRPDIVIISAYDYPRHWKTFAQFSKAKIAGADPQIILFAPADFSESEIDKAKALGIKGYFSAIDEKGLDDFSTILKSKDPVYKDAAEKQVVTAKEQPVAERNSVIFTHPRDNTFITGTITSLQGTTLSCTLDIQSSAANLHKNDYIAEISVNFNHEYSYYSGVITEEGRNLCLTLEKYEE